MPASGAVRPVRRIPRQTASSVRCNAIVAGPLFSRADTSVAGVGAKGAEPFAAAFRYSEDFHAMEEELRRSPCCTHRGPALWTSRQENAI